MNNILIDLIFLNYFSFDPNWKFNEVIWLYHSYFLFRFLNDWDRFLGMIYEPNVE